MASSAPSRVPLVLGALAVLAAAVVGFLALSGDETERADSVDLVSLTPSRDVDEGRTLPAFTATDTAEAEVESAVIPDIGGPADASASLVPREGPSGDIEGRVLDPFGQPLPDVAITCYLGNALISGSFPGARDRVDVATESGSDGTFVLSGIPAGQPYVVVGEHPEYAISEVGGIVVRVDKTTDDVELRMTQGATISGRVVNDSDMALPDVRVEFYDTLRTAMARPEDRRPWRVVFTNDNGEFQIPHVSSKSFQVRVEKDGYESQSQNISHALEAGPRNEHLEFVMHPGQSLPGRVVTEDGQGIEGARVEAIALRKEYSSNSVAVADAGGYFLLEGLGTSYYRIHTSARGYSDNVNAKAHVSAGEITVTLERRVAIEGQVVGGSGRPVTDFTLHLLKIHDSGQVVYLNDSRTFQSEDGRFEFDNLDPGEYALEARAKGFADTRSDLVTVARETPYNPVVTIRMTQGGTLRGVVYDPDGQPVAGAKVTLNENNFVDTPFLKLFAAMAPEERRLRSVRTGKDGSFEFTLVTPDTYQVAVKHADYAPRAINDVAVFDDTTSTNPPLEIALPKGALIEGVARDYNDLPLKGTKVTLTQKGTGFMEAGTTDGKGRFAFENLTEGTYTITVTPERIDGKPVHPFEALVWSQRSQTEIYLSEGQIADEVAVYLTR